MTRRFLLWTMLAGLTAPVVLAQSSPPTATDTVTTLAGTRKIRSGIVFSPDATQVTGFEAGSILFWDLQTRQRAKALKLSYPDDAPILKEFQYMTFVGDGQIVAGTLEYDHAARLFFWDSGSGRLIRTLELSDDTFKALDVSRDGRKILTLKATRGKDPTLEIWNGETGDREDTLPLDSLAEHVAVSPDGRRYLLVYKFNIEVRNIENHDVEHRFTIAEVIPNETKTVALKRGGVGREVTVNTVYEFRGPSVFLDGGRQVALLCTGRYRKVRQGLGNFENFNVLRIVDLASGRIRQGHKQFSAGVSSLSVSANGTLLALPDEGIELVRLQ